MLDNLTRVHVAGGTAARDHWYCYDPTNRLTNVKTGGCSTGATVVGLGYDVRGNLQNKNGTTYNFDHGNRLRSIDGAEAYRYDGLGRRVLSWSAQGLGNLLSQYDQAGRLVYQHDQRLSKGVEQVYLGGRLVAQRERTIPSGANVAVTYLHTDALGSPVAATDAAGTRLRYDEYEPFGKRLNRANDNRPGHTGHVMDAVTGLTYMQQRYYDPGIGTFLSVDPVTALSNPVGMFNRYRYAAHNPYRFTDPDGRAHDVFWTNESTVTVVIPFAISDPTGSAKFTSAQVSAVIQDKFSGSVEIDGVQVQVNAVGLPVELNSRTNNSEHVNVIDVNPDTKRSRINAVGGNRIDLRGSAGVDVVAHELGHAAGAGDQYAGDGAVNAAGQLIPSTAPSTTGNVMGDMTGKANSQTLREVVTAPTATRACAGGVQNGACP